MQNDSGQQKIISIEEGSREENQPITIESVFKNLQSLPANSVHDYVNVVEKQVEETLLWKNIFVARGNPNQCRFLIEGLNQTQFEKLNKIVLGMIAEDIVDSQINELIELSFGLVVPSETTTNKAFKLMSMIKTLDCDYEASSKRLSNLSWNLRTLAVSLVILNMAKEAEAVITDRFSALPEAELDQLIEIVESRLVTKLM